MPRITVKEIEDKNIVWFKNSNSYLVFEPVVAKIISKIDAQTPVSEIEDWCFNKLKVPKEISTEFVNNIHEIYSKNTIPTKDNETKKASFNVPTYFYSIKQYAINGYIFQMQFETEYHESKIHPVFAHLETDTSSNYNFNYQIFDSRNSIVFLKNNDFIGSWTKNEVHLFQGKLSMHLLIDMYNKPERDWLGVFHASAISNGKESLLFLGDSGNGKSTSLALLNANGYHSIADDFVPIDSHKNIYTYPAAISIKKNSVKTLLPFYPELEKAAEYHYKKLHKIVRYLPPQKNNYSQKLKCKALVFIKYNSDTELEVKSISKIDAFQQLIPDSWISPLEKNTTVFLDWFLELPCYQLTYSDTNKMLETVSKLFKDDL